MNKIFKIIIILSCIFLGVNASAQKNTGQQPGGDTIGGPETRREINNSGRKPKEINEVTHGNGRDSNINRKPAVVIPPEYPSAGDRDVSIKMLVF